MSTFRKASLTFGTRHFLSRTGLIANWLISALRSWTFSTIALLTAQTKTQIWFKLIVSSWVWWFCLFSHLFTLLVFCIYPDSITSISSPAWHFQTNLHMISWFPSAAFLLFTVPERALCWVIWAFMFLNYTERSNVLKSAACFLFQSVFI
jgi:hypothetical protein